MKKTDPLNKLNDLSLPKVSGIVAVITFLANLITVGLFFRDLYQGNLPTGGAIAQVTIIVVVFGFAFLLLFYSRQKDESLDGIIWLFSWLYILFSAAIFGVISYRFIVEANYNFGEFIGSIALIILIAALGYCVSVFIEKPSHYFSIPFMFVALWQIILWIFQIFARKTITFSWAFAGNLLLFIVASAFVLFFIWEKEHNWWDR